MLRGAEKVCGSDPLRKCGANVESMVCSSRLSTVGKQHVELSCCHGASLASHTVGQGVLNTSQTETASNLV